jgi:hypothetical protein
MRPLIAADDDQREMRKATAAFQTKVVTYLNNARLLLRHRTQQARDLHCLARRLRDLTKALSVLRARDAPAKFNEALPCSI